MRHKYATTGIVLGRMGAAEASAHVLLLTKDLGLIRARAQGVRKPGAKLAGALQTLVESDVVVVHGKEGWRLSGAVLIHNWFQDLPYAERERAGRIATLILRLIQGQTQDPALFAIFSEYLRALAVEATEDERDARECLAALRILRALGLDAGSIPGGESSYEPEVLSEVTKQRRELIVRINRGIAASGL